MAILTGSENLTAKFYIEGVYVGNGIASNAAGPNGAIQFNSNGNFAGSSNLLYTDANGGTLTTATIVVGNIVTPSGNLAVANMVSNGTIAGNVITANVMAANTANIANLTSNGTIAGNVITANTANIANLTSNVITANTANLVDMSVTGILEANVLTANTANLVDLSVTGNANLGDVSNVHIGGGLPGQFLQTDSTGNLVWADAATGNAIPYMNWTVPIDGPGQSFVNANIALYNDPTDMSVFLNGVFVNPIDFTILNDTITFSSSLKSTDSIEIASKSAGTGGSTGTGTVTRVGGTGAGLGFTLTGNVITSGNLVLTTPNATSLRTSLNLGNVANANFNANGSQFLAGNGAWTAIANATFANTANIANTANAVALANVVGIGNIANINLNGNVLTVLAGNGQWVTQSSSTLFSYATEVVTLVTHTTGTYTHDLLTSSIVYSTATATGPVVVAYRGNISTTVNTLLSVGTSITATYVMTTGSTGYAVTGITVDGTSQTVNWVGGVTPSVVANTKMSYTFTMIKTAANTYTVLGSATRFG